MKVYLRNFKPNEVKLAEAVTKIGEGLLELAGVTEILDTPFGQRIFTVERIPDNVPMAGIYWETYEPHYRERIAYESLRAGQIDYRGDLVRMEPAETAARHYCEPRIPGAVPVIVPWGSYCPICGWKAEPLEGTARHPDHVCPKNVPGCGGGKAVCDYCRRYVPQPDPGVPTTEDEAYNANAEPRDCTICGNDPEYRERCTGCGGSGKEAE